MDNDAEFLGLVMVLTLIFASILAWCVFVARTSSGTLLSYVPRRHVPWGLIDLGLSMALVIVSSIVAGELLIEAGVVERGQKLENMSPQNAAVMLLVSSMAILAGVVLTLGLVWLKNRPTASDLGLSTRSLGRDLWIGFAGFLLVAAPVYAIQFLLVDILGFRSEHPLIELVQQNPDVRFFLVSFVAAVVIAPFAEEFLFRVLLQGWLERIPGHRGDTRILFLGGADVTSIVDQNGSPTSSQEKAKPEEPIDQRAGEASIENPYVAPKIESRPAVWPIIVSAAVFALMHGSHGVDPVPLFVLAFGLGFVYRQTHRVLPCILIHMLFNGFSLALLLAEVYGANTPAPSG